MGSALMQCVELARVATEEITAKVTSKVTSAEVVVGRKGVRSEVISTCGLERSER